MSPQHAQLGLASSLHPVPGAVGGLHRPAQHGGLVRRVPGELEPRPAAAEHEDGGGEGAVLALVLQKVACELHPKVRNHKEGPY